MRKDVGPYSNPESDEQFTRLREQSQSIVYPKKGEDEWRIRAHYKLESLQVL